MLKLQLIFRPVIGSRCYRAVASSGQNYFEARRDFDDDAGDIPKQREVIKNVYKESEITANRPENEIDGFKSQHNITLVGEAPKPVLTVDEVNMPDRLKQLFHQRKITTPTPIQSLCWPLALSGKDMIGVAQTGSGKTLGYLVPSGAHIVAQPFSNSNDLTALVLAPTRELVQQITQVSRDWLYPSMKIKDCSVYGGASRMIQINELRRGVQLCVATPGRLIDLVTAREVSLRNASFLVLDEADRMLDMGFEPQIRQIVSTMRKDRQTLMFSATWPQDVRSLASEFMQQDAVRVNIGSTELCASRNIKQEFRFIDNDQEKSQQLADLLEEHKDVKILIFCATQRRVTQLAMGLMRDGIRCVESHGAVSQAKRERALQLFKGPCNVLVATDVAARGLDVSNIKIVVNFDFPNTVEDYVHRIGRTGRMNNEGRAVTFFTPENKAYAKGLVELLQQAEQEVPVELSDYVDATTPVPRFRRQIQTSQSNYREHRARNWKTYAKRY